MIHELDQVNEWARKSCPKWNKNRLTRKLNRNRYQNAAEKFWEGSNFQAVINFYKEVDHHTNTYPWPYRDDLFANWKEDDSPEGYSLITDQSNCVIRHSTSYCAWKIFEATGTWPQKTSKERLDAKDWQQFLAEAGYTEVLENPDELSSEQNPENRYVGIYPSYGEWGLVVWYEEPHENNSIWVSSYVDRCYSYFETYPDLYTWVKIK